MEAGSDWEAATEDRRILIEQVRKLQGELERSTDATAKMEAAMVEKEATALEEQRAGRESSDTQLEVLVSSLEVRLPTAARVSLLGGE
jgi:hypothetical protein